MNDSRFAFTHQPFPASPRIDQYVDVGSSDSIRKHCVEAIRRNAGPSVILGGAGLGKTITCMRIMQSCSNLFDCIFLSSSQIASRADLLKSLLYELRMPYRGLFDGELRLSLIERLQHRNKPNAEKVVLVVDEAQSLSPRLLEELRLLTNLTANGSPCLSLILCGSLKLEEMLASPQLESLQQRVTARHFLRPLNKPECAEYIRHRVELAGVLVDRVFDESAVDAIFLVSQGIPRLIDQTAERALAMDDARNQRPLNANDIERAWHASQQATPPWTDLGGITAVKTHAWDTAIATEEDDLPNLREVASDTRVETHAPPAVSKAPAIAVKSDTVTEAVRASSTTRPTPEQLRFVDSDLSGWTPEEVHETSQEKLRNHESEFAAQLLGTPPSAGMGLSSVLLRDQDQQDAEDIVRTYEDSLNRFNSEAVTEAYQHSFEPEVETYSATYQPKNRSDEIELQSIEDAPTIHIQSLSGASAGYGQRLQDPHPFDLQPSATKNPTDIEDDLFEMISNINLESISIDPFFEVNSLGKRTAETASAFDSAVSPEETEHRTVSLSASSQFSSVASSFFRDLDRDDEEYIEVHDIGPNTIDIATGQHESNAMLYKRLADLEDIARVERKSMDSLMMSNMDDGPVTLPFDDRGIIVVEEDVESTHDVAERSASKPVANALMQSYSKLFTELRG